MGLEVLKDVKDIGGFNVLDERPKKFNGAIDFEKFDELRKAHPIYIDHDFNLISFRLQNGPIKEVGVNGCQVDTLLHAALLILQGFNKKIPCRENSLAITKIEEAIHWLEHSTTNREVTYKKKDSIEDCRIDK